MTETIDKEILWKIIERSKKEPELATQAAAAITRLNEMGEDFSEKDLSGVNIPGADLKNAEMEGVNFSGANLRGVRFTQANLKKAKFNNAKMYGVKFEEMIELMENDDLITLIEFSPNSEYVAAVSAPGNSIKLWSVSSGELLRIFEGHTATINSIDFSPENNKMVTSSNDNTAILWNIETGGILQKYEGHTDCVTSAVFILNDSVATGSLDSKVYSWSQSTGEKLRAGVVSNAVTCLASDLRNNILAVGCKNNEVKCWNIEKHETLAVLTQSFESVKKIQFSFDGSKLIVFGDAGKINVWGLDTFKIAEKIQCAPKKEGAGTNIISAGFVSGSRGILAHTLQGKLAVRDLFQPRNRMVPLGNDKGVPACLAFSSNTGLFAIGDNVGGLRLWDLSALELINLKRAFVCASFADFDGAIGLDERIIKLLQEAKATNYTLGSDEGVYPWQFQYQGMSDDDLEKLLEGENRKERVNAIISVITVKMQTFAKFHPAINRKEQEGEIEKWIKNAVSLLKELLPISDIIKLSLDDFYQTKADYELTEIIVDELKSIFLIEEDVILKQQLNGAIGLVFANINILLRQERQNQNQIDVLGNQLTQLFQSAQKINSSENQSQEKTFSDKAKGALGDMALSAGKGAAKEVSGELAGKVTDEVLSSNGAKALGSKISGLFKR